MSSDIKIDDVKWYITGHIWPVGRQSVKLPIMTETKSMKKIIDDWGNVQGLILFLNI